MPRSARRHGAKTDSRWAGSPAQSRPERVSSRRYCSGSALAAYGTKWRRPKGNDRRFPGETLIMGLRSRPSRRGFNFWALLRAAGGFGRARWRERRSSESRRPFRQRRGYTDPPPRSAQKLQCQSPEEKSTVPRHTNRLSSNRPDSRFREEA